MTCSSTSGMDYVYGYLLYSMHGGTQREGIVLQLQSYGQARIGHWHFLEYGFFAFFRLIFVSLRFFRLIFAYFTFVFASDFWCYALK